MTTAIFLVPIVKYWRYLQVEAVEQYLARIGGSAKIRALKSALAGLDRDFLRL